MSELYELPDGWEWKKLEDVAKFQNGFAFKSKEFNTEKHGLQVIRIGNVLDINKNPVYIDSRAEFDKYLLKENDIVISMTGTRNKKDYLFLRIVNTNNSYLNQRVGKITNNEKSTYRYLYYFLKSNSFRDKIFEYETGTVNQGNISAKDILNSDIPIPPLPEQQRIVSKLDLLFEKIDKSIALHQKNMDEADLFMGSVLNDVFGELENKYAINTLNNICTKITDGTHKSPKTIDNGYPYITVRDVTSKGKIDFDNCEFVGDEDFNQLKHGNCAPIKNDVLFSKDGTVGKVTVVDFDKDFVVLSSLAILRPSEKLNPYFLYYAMKNPNFLEFAISKKSGAAIKRVVLRTIKEFNIPLPELSIQKKVVKYLDEISEKIEKIKSVQKEKMDSLVALKASVLDKAFRGEL